MPRQYSIAEARAHLHRIVSQAEAGEQIELTRRGKVIAVVVSAQLADGLARTRSSFGAAYEHFVATHDLNDVGLDEPFLTVNRGE